jgi:hypothetical protein
MAVQHGHRYINSTVKNGGRGHWGDVNGDVYNNCPSTWIYIEELSLI